MKSYGRILWFVSVLCVTLAGAAYAIRPSGPGINTKANSLSVALATDQPSVPVHPGSTLISAVTPASATDLTANCKDGLLVGNPGDAGNVQFSPSGDAAAVTVTGLVSGERIPVGISKVHDGGNTTATVFCLSH